MLQYSPVMVMMDSKSEELNSVRAVVIKNFIKKSKEQEINFSNYFPLTREKVMLI